MSGFGDTATVLGPAHHLENEHRCSQWVEEAEELVASRTGQESGKVNVEDTTAAVVGLNSLEVEEVSLGKLGIDDHSL
jgi:hypothetical protein